MAVIRQRETAKICKKTLMDKYFLFFSHISLRLERRPGNIRIQGLALEGQRLILSPRLYDLCTGILNLGK